MCIGAPGENAPPYTTLYIYYLEGRLTSCDALPDPGFIGNWEEDGFSFLFFSEPSDDTVDRVTAATPGLILLDRYCMTYDEWLGETPEPFRAGRLFIVPPWDRTETPDGMQRILLDPGVVFGTGTHPTTRDCLEILQTLLRNERIDTALDLGTGTGLLALGAARMGCERVLALDFNFLAARTAARNVALNRLEHRILTLQGRAEEFIGMAGDLLIANIHYDVMKHLICSEGFLRKKWFILSGLLRTQAREVADTLSHYPVEIIETREREGVWHTFWGKTFP
ncbi:hypothetical protein DENIS_3815 [Desulfonema ishimotonii]|uniref:50S ribosomal protein L11 methyltransferase n=1 Tax=Desulfonema ishimotonii TaxID=45657 RepID=A0A401G0U0_9BACT|nr:hypothetical protein DENIS_3815 [Desulfonema ishimotonii]